MLAFTLVRPAGDGVCFSGAKSVYQAYGNGYLRPCHVLQVFTSASALAFETFACDDEVGDGDSYLRADYSLSCKTDLHSFFKGYALFMILVRSLACWLSYVVSVLL